MEPQQWKPTVLESSKKFTSKELKNQVNNPDVVTVNKANTGGKKMYDILNSEAIVVPVTSVELKQAIVKARNAKEWKQKDLAFAIGVKESIVSSYESGKSVPDNNLIAKMEKAMNCKLPRPPKEKGVEL